MPHTGACDPRPDMRVAGWAASVHHEDGERTCDLESWSHAGFIPSAGLFFVLRQSPTYCFAV